MFNNENEPLNKHEIVVDESGSTQEVPLMGQIPGANNLSDPLVQINHMFHHLYAEAGQSMRPDPIIVLEGDYLVLRWNNGTREAKPITPMIYHNLKMICHIPLVVFVELWPSLREALPASTQQALAGKLLSPLMHNPQLDTFLGKIGGSTITAQLPDSVVTNLTQLRTMVLAHNDSILNSDRFSDPKQLARQYQIVTSTLALLDSLLRTNPAHISLQQFVSFTRAIAPALSKNLDDAAAAQVNLLNEVFTEWNKTYSLAHRMKSGDNPDPLRHLRIAITTSHMARVQTLPAQYFSRFFQVNIDRNDRFMTLEQLSTEQQVLKLLDTAQTDLSMGWAFFGDMYRMQEDALCHGAKLALDKLFPESANTTIGCLPQG